jgi:hypothetical protein
MPFNAEEMVPDRTGATSRADGAAVRRGNDSEGESTMRRAFRALVIGVGALLALCALGRAPAAHAQSVEWKRFACKIVSVVKSGDVVTSVAVRVDSEAPNAGAWQAWVDGAIGTPVQFATSTIHHDGDDSGQVTDNAGGVAMVELDAPGSTHFSSDVGNNVNLFYVAK